MKSRAKWQVDAFASLSVTGSFANSESHDVVVVVVAVATPSLSFLLLLHAGQGPSARCPPADSLELR